ncbi:hypothetical protein F5J12DRAFT_711870, partial [Pisolithus orientalis]|uniref:uncharacterized protein n=1 Tax=Pisolithus orientalis TaxID=936130 RepID=UPI002225588E
HLVTEIGPVIVLPAFQCIQVESHVVGLLLRCKLELPPAGLHLLRVKWCGSPLNISFNNLAKRMRFKFERVSRWKFALPQMEGYPKVRTDGREGDAGNERLGRDSNKYMVC